MKFGIYTLGCKVNTYESEYVKNLLLNHDFIESDFNDICDIYIINTCTVTNTSDIKSRKIIRQARRRNKDACIIAMGCFIQADDNNIIDDIDIAIGNNDKSRIVELINKFFKDKKKIINKRRDFDDNFEDMFIEKYENRTRAFIKIQDGCENFCSYCIIPFVRGKCRSKDFNTVLEEIRKVVENGFKEVVLTGIHTGNYGVDINTNFASLLREIVKIDGLQRLRISSIEINELTDEVLDIIKNSPVVVNHLHIPIQAASDNVLKAMNRKYDLKTYMSRIKTIKTIKEDMSISTDIIVGHPYETDEDFKTSLDAIREIGFSKLHVFPYSKRNGTKSALMPQVDEIDKKRRARILLDLSREEEIKYMNKFIGKNLEVLIETNNGEYSLGHTTNYLHVKIYSDKHKSEDLVNLKLTKVEYPFIIGECN